MQGTRVGQMLVIRDARDSRVLNSEVLGGHFQVVEKLSLGLQTIRRGIIFTVRWRLASLVCQLAGWRLQPQHPAAGPRSLIEAIELRSPSTCLLGDLSMTRAGGLKRSLSASRMA